MIKVIIADETSNARSAASHFASYIPLCQSLLGEHTALV